MKTSTKTVISINNISKVYEGPPPVRALDGVSLEIKEGDFVSIVGQSGSGKSTFLNMIGLLDSITDGSIEIEGKDVSELSDNELSKFRGEKIGFIFQSFFLLPGLTAQENVAGRSFQKPIHSFYLNHHHCDQNIDLGVIQHLIWLNYPA